VAQLLGVHRNTIGHWLARYEAGGLDALLDVYVPAGKPLSLPPDVLAALEEALRQPAGFASYEALRQWVKQVHHLDVNYHTLYTIVRTRFNAKLKVPRPSHTKKPRRSAGVSGHLSGAAPGRHPAGE
jgi:transposase